MKDSNQRRWLRTVRVIVLLAGLGGLSLLQGQATQAVEGLGRGSTYDAALAAAKRDAVEKGVGVIIASETIVDNAKFDDRILSKADGFLKTWEEISRTQAADGLWEVKIRAIVTEILDEVVKDQAALDLLLSWMRHPRFMIIIDEQNVDDPTTSIAETEIGRIMGEKGFDLVSSSQSEALKERNVNLAEVQNDPLLAGALAAEFGAEYLVTGNARSVALSHELLGGRYSGQGNITAQVVRASNAQILAQETFHGKATHVDPITAGMYSLKDAAEQLADYLFRETVRKWSLEQSNARMVTLRINNVTYRDRKAIVNFLENDVDGIQTVNQRSFAAGLVTLAVEFRGTNDDLGGLIDGAQLNGLILYIIGETPAGFDITVEKK